MLFLLDLFFPVLALRFKIITMLWLLVLPEKHVFRPVESQAMIKFTGYTSVVVILGL